MASVEIKNVTKIYENKAKAVDKVSLSINDGEFVVLVGPSGCGKSTLLRMIAGLEDITDGEITIGPKVVNRVPAKDRDIAMVFQNYALYPHMTVYQNMAFGLKLRKFEKQEIDTRVREAAAILDLTSYLDRKPRQLSGGQRQRVAVGRAIVRKPAVFLFDEPLSNLDAKLRVQMRLEISKLHKKLRTTMIYVTHDQVEAMTMGERIVVINTGQVQQYGTPLDVYNNPLNRFVAGFIGSPSMNFIEGNIEYQGDNCVFKLNDLEWIWDKEVSQKLQKRHLSKIVLGIRPEHFILANEEINRFPSFNAAIELIEPMGNELFVHLVVSEIHITMRCAPDVLLNSEKKVNIAFNPERVHFFDGQSGNKI